MTSNLNKAAPGVQFSPRIMELRAKIQDADYLDYAIQRIAQVLSLKLVEDKEQQYNGGIHEPKRQL